MNLSLQGRSMKKAKVVAQLVLVSFLLVSCWPAEVDVSTTFKADGSGTRVIIVDIMDDTLSSGPIPNPEDPEATKGKGPVINDWHIDGGLMNIQTWLEQNSPSWMRIEAVSVDGVHRRFRMSYDFSSFDDFLAKYETLVNLSPNLSWNDFDAAEKPRWQTSTSGFDRTVTFTESRDIVLASLDWAADGIYNDLYNVQSLAGYVGKADIWALANYRVAIGDDAYEELRHYDKTRPDGEHLGKVVFVESQIFSLSGESRNTGLIIAVIAIAGAVVAAVVTLLLRKKKST